MTATTQLPREGVRRAATAPEELVTPRAATPRLPRRRVLTPSAAAGQAAVELVALLPLLLVVALVVFSVLAAGSADEQAGAAAEAAALALLQGGDPRAAALAALPGAVRPRATVTIHDRRVHVHVPPRLPLPGLAERLAGDAESDAGPATP